MKDGRIAFALILLGLLLTFSFNAYACVLPVDGGTHAATDHNCAIPGKEPVRQVCDLFKVFSLHAWTDPEPNAVPFSTHIEIPHFWSVRLVEESSPIPYPLKPLPRLAQEAPLLIPVLLL